MNLVGILLITIGLILDGLFIYFDNKYHGKSSIVLKTLASLMFVILAFYNCKDEIGMYICVALTLNMLGDFVLILRNLNKKYHDVVYGVGTLLFLIGHIFLSVYLIKLDSRCVLFGLLIDVLLFIKIGVYLIKIMKVNTKKLQIIGTIYVFIIMCTLGLSISSVFNNVNIKTIFFMISAFMFASSDVLLFIQKFKTDSPKWTQPTYRILYYISQIMFAIYLSI